VLDEQSGSTPDPTRLVAPGSKRGSRCPVILGNSGLELLCRLSCLVCRDRLRSMSSEEPFRRLRSGLSEPSEIQSMLDI
jgi:hypothetical protein